MPLYISIFQYCHIMIIAAYLLQDLQHRWGFVGSTWCYLAQKHVSLAASCVSGTISPVCSLEAVEVVNLSSNFLSGSVSDKIASLSNLKQLFLSENKLTGTQGLLHYRISSPWISETKRAGPQQPLYAIGYPRSTVLLDPTGKYGAHLRTLNDDVHLVAVQC